MPDASALGPIDPASITSEDAESEKAAPWIIRKLVGVSIAGNSPFRSAVHPLVVNDGTGYNVVV
jgi:hypothetical protein